MKKFCLILSIILLSSLSAFAINQTKERKYSDALLIRLQVCLILNETTTDKDTQTTITRSILGPENKTTLCRYKETITDKDKNKTEYNCKFTIEQKNALIKARAFSYFCCLYKEYPR